MKPPKPKLAKRAAPPLKVAEAAAELNVHPSRIYELIHGKVIAHYKMGKTKGIRINRESWEKYKLSIFTQAGIRTLAATPGLILWAAFHFSSPIRLHFVSVCLHFGAY